MGKSSFFELSGWKAGGGNLPVKAKHEIQDIVFETEVEDYGTSCTEQDPFIMSFGDESFSAYENVTRALADYAESHPDVLLDLHYECEEVNDYHNIRFQGLECEEYDRVVFFPPFVKLTFNGDDNPLPVIEFNFEAIDDEPAASILVLLDRCPDKDKLAALEDSISSYIDSVPAYGYEQLIHDVLSADGIGHWILKPTHTFNI